MNRTRQTALAAALAIAMGAPLAAGTSASAAGIGDRLENQQDRIEQGVDNGSLTKSEARRLRHRDAEIRQERHQLARDGSLSKQDKRKLQHDLNRTSGRIYDERHDKQER